MAFLRIILCVAFMVTVVLSKPVGQSEAENSSDESTETNSSEEAHATVRVSEEPQKQTTSEETTAAVSVEETEAPETADVEPTEEAVLSTSAPPAYTDPPAHTDPPTIEDTHTVLPMLDDLSQTTVTTTVQDATTEGTYVQPHSGLTQNNVTTQPPVVTTVHQVLPTDATASSPPLTIDPSPLPSSTVPPVPVSIGTAVTAVPVCFTVQFTTAEPEPPRGDSM
ncbi:mucin-2-like [Xyrichtys novacula]|uniref:Mucin-2-like n=1 Tax=Xyrichtys novacula TaxID=13765 RepID=A0AAV1G4S6_XYRNO|nr:mucin-2-like [Xyrichtys novacula]